MSKICGVFFLSKEIYLPVIYFWQQYQENFKIAEYPLHQFIHLVDHLEIRIALSNPNIDVRILAQGAYCVAIISLSLL